MTISRKVIAGAATACAMASFGQASAQQGITELVDVQARMDELTYGLAEVCLPAQRARQSVSEYEAANRDSLRLVRKETLNSTQVNTWAVNIRSDVAILEDDNGCTVSMSVWRNDAEDITAEVRGFLTGRADQYQVVAGDPDDDTTPLQVAFCATAQAGVVDSWFLQESLGEPQRIVGQRRRERQKFISIFVPTQPFCAHE